LRLNEKEKEKRDAIRKEQGYNGTADLEESCEGSKSYHYVVHPCNIGDTITLVYKGVEYDITDYECW